MLAGAPCVDRRPRRRLGWWNLERYIRRAPVEGAYATTSPCIHHCFGRRDGAPQLPTMLAPQFGMRPGLAIQPVRGSFVVVQVEAVKGEPLTLLKIFSDPLQAVA